VQSYNSGFGLKIDGTTSTSTILLTARDSVMADNLNGIWEITVSTGANIDVESDRNLITNKQIDGVVVDGAKAAITLTGSTVTANGTGVASQNGGLLFSYKNNNINGNLTANGTIPPGNIISQN
jgi:hypothetical protein